VHAVSPANLAPAIQMPVLLIHGEKDCRFPVEFAHQLKASFPPHQVELFVAAGVGHSDSSLTAEWPERVRSFLERRTAFD
jgi:dipeptidyl aminopeptidase/acylaminoacyl peptidase